MRVIACCADEGIREPHVFGAWEASVASSDQRAFGVDRADDLLLYVQGKFDGGELKVIEADLHVHFANGATNITRCTSPHDLVTVKSISCQREVGSGYPARIALSSRDSNEWEGTIIWRNTPVPVTFRRLKQASISSSAHPLAGEWQSSDPKCSSDERFHIRPSSRGDDIVTYDRRESNFTTLGEAWDFNTLPNSLELIERTDGSFGGSRIFVPQLSSDGKVMSGQWIGHNPLAGCRRFVRVTEENEH